MSTANVRNSGSSTTVAILAVLTVLAVTAGPASAGATKYCGEAKGPGYSLPGASPGSTYSVSATGVTCAFAKTWMRKLAGRRIGTVATALKGPAGWRCNGIPVVKGARTAAEGICRKGTLLFTWSPLAFGTG